jgi:hypothetical protein
MADFNPTLVQQVLNVMGAQWEKALQLYGHAR